MTTDRETLDRETLDRLFRYCFALTGQREDAEDLLHNSLEKYIHSRPGLVENTVAYIMRIARNSFIDQQRRQHHLPFDTTDGLDYLSDPEDDLENTIIDRLTLEKVWESLNPAEREAVYLWAVEGLSASEIGRFLDEPRGTILSRLHRLRRRVATTL